MAAARASENDGSGKTSIMKNSALNMDNKYSPTNLNFFGHDVFFNAVIYFTIINL